MYKRQVCYREFKVSRAKDGLDLGFTVTGSRDLSKNLEGCRGIILFAATCGIAPDRLIARYGRLSPAKALCFQAIGAERIESLCDEFNRDISSEAMSKGLYTRCLLYTSFYKAVSNASVAWLYGASAVNCSLLGIGERTGNVPLEAMVFEYASLRGSFDGMDPTAITEIASYFKNEMGYDIPPMTPFVGENFNVTKAGIHADGLMKDEEIYNIFNTRKLLNRAPGVAVSKTSGAAGIAYWINEHYQLPENKKVHKDSSLVKDLKTWVDEMYADGRTTSLSNAELENKIRELAKGGDF